jgi:hypothetical protein
LFDTVPRLKPPKPPLFLSEAGKGGIYLLAPLVLRRVRAGTPAFRRGRIGFHPLPADILPCVHENTPALGGGVLRFAAIFRGRL